MAVQTSVVRGQMASEIRDGERVRVYYVLCPTTWAGIEKCGHEGVATGRVVSLGRDTLVLDAGGERRALAAGDIIRFQRHAGRRRPFAEGALIGFLGGTALGGVIGLVFAPEQGPSETVCGWFGGNCYQRPDSRPAEFVGGSMMVGATGGTLIGVLAAMAFPVDRWQPAVIFVPSQGTVARRAHLGLRFTF